MRIVNHFLAIFVCLASFAVVAEEPTHYRVELILFSQRPVQGDDEIWPPIEHRPSLGDVLPLALDSIAMPVSKESASMDSILYTLKQSSLYQPLLHTAWEQPGWSEEEAQAIRIEIPFGAELPVTLFSENAPAAVITDENSPLLPGLPSFVTSEEPVPVERDDLLSGTIKIHRARYLHAEFDLIYRDYVDVPVTVLKPSPDDPTVAVESVGTVGQLVEIPMHQKRRMRSKERHYIDNPRLGALIEITPVEIEEEPVEPVIEEPPVNVPEPN